MRVELSNVGVAIEEGATLVHVGTVIFGKHTGEPKSASGVPSQRLIVRGYGS